MLGKCGVTAERAAHSIGVVSPPAPREPVWPGLVQAGQRPALRPLLTRRRAVDYCRVATALCRRAPRRSELA